jgi:hypothetical protein
MDSARAQVCGEPRMIIIGLANRSFERMMEVFFINN